MKLARPALALVSLTTALVGVELMARSMSPSPAVGAVRRASVRGVLFQKDPTLSHAPIPGASLTVWEPEWQSTVAFNTFGMRGTDPGRLPKNGRRVLVLGDSFTLGMQVDDPHTYPRQLEALLSETAPTHVWNAGVDDYGTTQATARARQLLARGLRFDAIVLTVFMGNDLNDNLRSAPGRHGPPSATTAAPIPAPTLLAPAWARVLAARWTSGSSADHRAQVRADFQLWCDDNTLTQALPATRSALASLASLARTHDTPLVIALAPPVWVRDPTIGQETADWLGLTGFDPTRVPAALTAAAPAGVPVVDLTPALRTAHNTAPVHFRTDPHWTAHGHEAVARALQPAVDAALTRPDPGPPGDSG